MRSSQHSPQLLFNSFRLLVVCDPVAQASRLVTFIPHSNDRPRGAVQNVAVSPQPSSAIELLAQKDVLHKSLRDRSAHCVAPAEVQVLPPRTLSTLGGPKSTQLLHAMRGTSQGQIFWLLLSEARRASGYVDRTVYSLSVSAQCAKKLPSQPGAKTVCASIWKEKSSRASSRLSNNFFQLAYMTVFLPPNASFGACVRGSPLWRILRAQAWNVRTCNGIFGNSVILSSCATVKSY